MRGCACRDELPLLSNRPCAAVLCSGAMDCRHTECARAFMAWFQIMTWKKPWMLRAVPDDALVDDAVTAAGLRTWKKLWMLRTAPDDGLITRHRLHNVQQGRGQRTHNAQPRRRPSKGGDELHQNKGLGVSCWAARPLAYPPPLDGSL